MLPVLELHQTDFEAVVEEHHVDVRAMMRTAITELKARRPSVSHQLQACSQMASCDDEIVQPHESADATAV